MSPPADGEPGWCRTVAAGVEVEVWVAPGGSRSALTGFHGGRVRVAVAAPPEGGKANDAVQRLLADAAGVAVGQVSLLRGARGRAKRWLVATAQPELACRRIAERAAAGSR